MQRHSFTPKNETLFQFNLSRIIAIMTAISTINMGFGMQFAMPPFLFVSRIAAKGKHL